MSLKLITLKAASRMMGNEIPSNWLSMDQGQKLDWLTDSVACQFENTSPEEALSILDDHAADLAKMVKSVLARVKEGIVNGAIEGDLPHDYNEMDLESLGGLY
jgi:hypothetical protein